MNHIDVVFYINLASRADRNTHFLQEIPKLSYNTPVQRIDAVYNSNGALGCTLSHIKTLETFLENPEWKTCVIFEDDFTFRSSDLDDNNDALERVFKTFPDWDCCMLSAGSHDLKFWNTEVETVKKVHSAQTTSGYCVTKTFAPTLLNNYRESRDLMIRNGRMHENCLDQYWKKLQPTSHWYLVFPALGYQYHNYSDIEERVVGYGC